MKGVTLWKRHQLVWHSYGICTVLFSRDQTLVDLVMDLTRQLKLLVLIILVGYFVNKILVAKTKLDERKIGTLLRKINSDTVKGSLCY